MIYKFATKKHKKIKLKNRIFLREIAYCKIKSATMYSTHLNESTPKNISVDLNSNFTNFELSKS